MADLRKYGEWTGQVKAVAVAHVILAAANLSAAFYVRPLWDRESAQVLKSMMMQLGGDAEMEQALREGLQRMEWAVPAIVGVVVVFSALTALNGIYLWLGRNWARVNAIVIGALLLAGIVTLPIGAWFIYVAIRPDVAAAFRGKETHP